jgi:subfamily B ATP-binding cassette protein MsbA
MLLQVEDNFGFDKIMGVRPLLTIRPDTATLRWLLPYFGRARGAWALAVLATIVASATEPLLPALIKPLLDRGFQPGGIALWMVPASLLLLFAVRGSAGFLADLALAKTPKERWLVHP